MRLVLPKALRKSTHCQSSYSTYFSRNIFMYIFINSPITNNNTLNTLHSMKFTDQRMSSMKLTNQRLSVSPTDTVILIKETLRIYKLQVKKRTETV